MPLTLTDSPALVERDLWSDMHEQPSRHLGLDLGGTNIKLTVVETHAGTEPRVVAASSVPTLDGDGPDAVTARMVAAGRAFATEHGPVSTVGVGIPGLFNPDTGRIKLFPNLRGSWPGFPLLAAELGTAAGAIGAALAGAELANQAAVVGGKRGVRSPRSSQTPDLPSRVPTAPDE